MGTDDTGVDELRGFELYRRFDVYVFVGSEAGGKNSLAAAISVRGAGYRTVGGGTLCLR